MINLSFELFYFTDKIRKIKLTTGTILFADSSESIQIQICQNRDCCQTKTLPGHYARGSTISFSGSTLGECENKKIDANNEAIEITPKTLTSDGWRGTLTTIHTTNQENPYECIITRWIDKGFFAVGPEKYETTCRLSKYIFEV